MTIVAWVVADIYHTQSHEAAEAEIALPPIQSISVNTQLLESIRIRE
jgi:hypothetical protein